MWIVLQIGCKHFFDSKFWEQTLNFVVLLWSDGKGKDFHIIRFLDQGGFPLTLAYSVVPSLLLKDPSSKIHCSPLRQMKSANAHQVFCKRLTLWWHSRPLAFLAPLHVLPKEVLCLAQPRMNEPHVAVMTKATKVLSWKLLLLKDLTRICKYRRLNYYIDFRTKKYKVLFNYTYLCWNVLKLLC